MIKHSYSIPLILLILSGLFTGCSSWYQAVTNSIPVTEQVASQLSDGDLKLCMEGEFVYSDGKRVNCLLHGRNDTINRNKDRVQNILRKEYAKRYPK